MMEGSHSGNTGMLTRTGSRNIVSRPLAQMARRRPFCLSRQMSRSPYVAPLTAHPRALLQQKERDMNLDMSKLEPLLGTVVNELGAASNGALVILGDRLGLFRALAQAEASSVDLARKTGTNERMVREWLSAQAASGYVNYHKDTNTFSMSPEQ